MTGRLAITSYGPGVPLADADGVLNLAWTVDERDCLTTELRRVLADELTTEVRDGLPSILRYPVDDPYGEAFLGPAVRRHFDHPLEPAAIVAGAGVISLLHALAAWSATRPAYVIGATYPDFPYWVEHRGGRCVGGPETLTVEQHLAAVEQHDAGLIFLERPSLVGDHYEDLASTRALCQAAAAQGVTVIVDESNGNYWPPRFSAVALTAEVESLVVLRGLSKAYGLGGLRLGYAVASDALRGQLAATVPPLLASSLSLTLGRAVLEAGDVGERLRDRIRLGKALLCDHLGAIGAGHAILASRHLPYVLVEDDQETVIAQLQADGIRGKQHLVWRAGGAGPQTILRLSAPLHPDRVDALRTRLSARLSGRAGTPSAPDTPPGRPTPPRSA